MNFKEVSKCFLALFVSLFFYQQSHSQELQVSYFGHAGYTAKLDNEPSTKTQSAFNTGGVDILLTSQISDRFSVLGELFTGFRGDGANSVSLSIERLYFKYAVAITSTLD